MRVEVDYPEPVPKLTFRPKLFVDTEWVLTLLYVLALVESVCVLYNTYSQCKFVFLITKEYFYYMTVVKGWLLKQALLTCLMITAFFFVSHCPGSYYYFIKDKICLGWQWVMSPSYLLHTGLSLVLLADSDQCKRSRCVSVVLVTSTSFSWRVETIGHN